MPIARASNFNSVANSTACLRDDDCSGAPLRDSNFYLGAVSCYRASDAWCSVCMRVCVLLQVQIATQVFVCHSLTDAGGKGLEFTCFARHTLVWEFESQMWDACVFVFTCIGVIMYALF